jgi:hypothetical membrane protein
MAATVPRPAATGRGTRTTAFRAQPPHPVVKRAAVGGLIGPAAFVGAWAIAGSIKDGYSPTNDAISRLAAVGASTRPLMTSGFVCFGLAVPAYALALRRWIGGPAWMTAAATGVATLAVGAVPLGMSPTGDLVHGGLATAGYVTLTATPLLAGATLRAAGRRLPATVSWATGTVAGLCLAATLTGRRHGLWQRAGLTVGDAWLAATALAMVIGRPRAAPPVDGSEPALLP